MGEPLATQVEQNWRLVEPPWDKDDDDDAPNPNSGENTGLGSLNNSMASQHTVPASQNKMDPVAPAAPASPSLFTPVKAPKSWPLPRYLIEQREAQARKQKYEDGLRVATENNPFGGDPWSPLPPPSRGRMPHRSNANYSAGLRKNGRSRGPDDNSRSRSRSRGGYRRKSKRHTKKNPKRNRKTNRKSHH